jgi:hypothetical protein
MSPAYDIPALLTALSAKEAPVRFGAAKTFELLSGESPERVYPHFDFFARMLHHENQVLRWNAIAILANLAPADDEGKLDRILTRYLAPIAGPAFITAANTIRGAARIAQCKPHLAPRIIRAILRVERASYPSPVCRDIAIGHACVALAALPPTPAVRAFARRNQNNPRHPTAAKAAKLLRKLSTAESRTA